MHKIKLVVSVIILLTIPSISFAQNNTNSPYTRYGYGNLADKAFAAQRGMGGIGYGLRNPQLINPMNPASFSSVDSMTFMMDFGVMGQLAWFKDDLNKVRKGNANIEYIALQFPIMKRMGVGAGFEPVSFVGYAYGDTAHISVDDGYAQYTYEGNGGLNKVYAALSYNFLDRLSLGVKVSYLFGDVVHDNLVMFTDGASSTSGYSTNWLDTLRTSGFTYDIGLQYLQPIGKDQSLVFGAVYTPKTKINGRFMESIYRFEPTTGSVMSSEHYASSDSIFEMPESYAFGITYNKLDKLTLGADFLYQKWADAKFYDKTDALSNRMKINIGGEYIPNIMSNNFFNRVRYRAGAHYSDSYVKVKDSGYKEYGANIGFGFPMNDRRSFINLAFEYSFIRPEVNTLIDEQYLKLTLSYTFNELWFFKRKLQ